MMDAISIATSGVMLDDWVEQPGDLDCVKEAASDPEIPRGTTVPSEYTTEAGRAFIERQRNRRHEGIGWSLAIRDPATKSAVGQIGLWSPELRKGRAEIGYWVAPPHRGSGYASAALDALSDWAFAHLDIGRLTLSIEPGNVASIATARRAGFEREALLRNWQYLDGEPVDLVVFGRFG